MIKKKLKIIFLLVFLLFFIDKILSGYTENNNTKIIINIPSRELELIENNKVIKTYPVGVGEEKFPSPIGNNFKIISKVVNPSWQNPYKSYSNSIIKPGKKSPIGTRWMSFYKYKLGEYGIHGTNEVSSIRKYSSHGCIRMRIRDSEDLFSRVNIGTQIIINNYPLKVYIKNNKIYVKKYPLLYKNNITTEKMLKDQFDYYNQPFEIRESDLIKIDRLKLNQITSLEINQKNPEEENAEEDTIPDSVVTIKTN